MTRSGFFPRQSVQWKLEEPPALRRLSLSLPEMALITGVPLHLWRAFALTHGTPDSWAWVGGTFLAGMTFLYVMLTLHLGNFTIRTWAWRAPAFAVLVSGSEIVTSLALTALGLEPLGAEKAELSDWLPTATRILVVRLVGVLLFAFVLAIVVGIVRRLLLAGEHRGHTVEAVHRASVEQQAHAEVEKDVSSSE
ncbi:MAG: hypothetical protein HYR75_05040 [Gemmatimonadetes bacterium]|nr:hypothetical protein [Gemmatimonadota bacterium]MBI3504338.1 hypothetical protein [Pseudomonadota bacterium]